MAITAEEIKKKIGNHWRTEYTQKCGWIDWEHAVPGRGDIEAIWRQLPHQLKRGQKALQLNRVKAGNHSYFEVTFDIDQNMLQRTMCKVLPHCQSRHTYYVLDLGTSNELHYEKAALYIFMVGCLMTETVQYKTPLEWKSQSGFSMEDLVSDLLAFFGHVDAMTRETIIKESGGWVDPNVAQQKSLQLFTAITSKGRQAPKAIVGTVPIWFKAYLYNDLIDGGDKRTGWHLLPDRFQVRPHLLGDKPPAPVMKKDSMEKLWRDWARSAGRRAAPGRSATGVGVGAAGATGGTTKGYRGR